MQCPVILLGGLLCPPRMWGSVLTHLKLRYPTRTFLIPPIPNALTMDKAAEVINSLVDGPFAIAGLSMGGYISLQVAASYPQKISGLFMANSQSRPDGPEVKKRRLATIALVETSGLEGLCTVLEAQAKLLLHPSCLPTDVPSGVRGILHSEEAWSTPSARATPFHQFVSGAFEVGPAAFIQQQHCIMSRIDHGVALKALGERGVPLWVLTGALDAVTPLACAQEMKGWGGEGCTLTVLDDCAHLSPIEQPLGLSKAIIEWLEKVDRK